MPFALLTLGILFIVIGFQDTYKQFGTQVVSDFSGANSFIYFMVAIGAVGAIGYIKPLQTPSHVFMALIITSLFIGAVNKGGFFNNLTTGLNSGSTTPVTNIGDALPANSSSASSGSSSGSSGSGILDDLGTVATIASFF